jgi:hypothetical protein
LPGLLLGHLPGLLNNRGMPLLNQFPNSQFPNSQLPFLYNQLLSSFSPSFHYLWPRHYLNLPFRRLPSTRFGQSP